MTGINEMKNTVIVMLAGIALYHIAQISGVLNTIIREEVPTYPTSYSGYEAPKRR